MRRDNQPVTLENIYAARLERGAQIRARLAEFQAVWESASDETLFEEMVYCIFTAGASARMGLNSVEAVRHLLRDGAHEDLAQALKGRHRYPLSRPQYVVATRAYLREDCGMQLREKLSGFTDTHARRDWLARTRGIKGLGYKEASHYLRNVGFRGYAILDKHILRSLAELGVIETPQPPTTRARYLETEERMRQFAHGARIDFDELDLILWSMKTGEVLK